MTIQTSTTTVHDAATAWATIAHLPLAIAASDAPTRAARMDGDESAQGAIIGNVLYRTASSLAGRDQAGRVLEAIPAIDAGRWTPDVLRRVGTAIALACLHGPVATLVASMNALHAMGLMTLLGEQAENPTMTDTDLRATVKQWLRTGP